MDDQESNKLYMKHPLSKTLAGWRMALDIFEKYGAGKGRLEIQAEHDILYGPIRLDDLAEDSEDGRTLLGLGWHADTDGECWAYFT